MIQHVVRGTTQTFYARVYDENNELVDPNTIEAYVLESGEIYPEGTSYVVNKQATGIYYITISVADDAVLGSWKIYWRVLLGEEWYNEEEPFEVDAGADLFFDSDVLMINQEYTITINGSIRDSLGNEFGSNTEVYFYTELEPMYCTVQDIRLEIGQYISNIPDYTIALKIWKSSTYADHITYITVPKSGKRHDYYVFAREQFVKASAVVDLLNLVIMETGGGHKKLLGDLEITKFGLKLADNPLISDWAKQRKGWQWVIENGGEMTPGSGHKPGVAVKAGSHPNRPNIGREWIIGEGVNSKTLAEDTIGGSKTRAKLVKIKYANWSASNGD